MCVRAGIRVSVCSKVCSGAILASMFFSPVDCVACTYEFVANLLNYVMLVSERSGLDEIYLE